jgi:peptidoglycan/xylan/chitin deacetylase (PgdA/CDA1 family)
MKYKNLVLAHNIGNINHSNYHTRKQILDCPHPIGFDGIYYNVYDNQDVLKNKSGILFVMGNYIGKDNSFDLEYVPKLEKYCTWHQLEELVDKYDFELGWHTWNHPDLTTLNREQIINEITPPLPMKYFAYPYGSYNQLVIDCVKEVGYEQAWSVTQGSQNPNELDFIFKQYRPYL